MDAKDFCELCPNGGVDFRLTRYDGPGADRWYASLHPHPGNWTARSMIASGATAEEALTKLRALVAPATPPNDIDDLI